MFCGECGTKNPDGVKFCFKCGKPMPVPEADVPAGEAAPVAPAPGQGQTAQPVNTEAPAANVVYGAPVPPNAAPAPVPVAPAPVPPVPAPANAAPVVGQTAPTNAAPAPREASDYVAGIIVVLIFACIAICPLYMFSAYSINEKKAKSEYVGDEKNAKKVESLEEEAARDIGKIEEQKMCETDAGGAAVFFLIYCAIAGFILFCQYGIAGGKKRPVLNSVLAVIAFVMAAITAYQMFQFKSGISASKYPNIAKLGLTDLVGIGFWWTAIVSVIVTVAICKYAMSPDGNRQAPAAQ